MLATTNVIAASQTSKTSSFSEYLIRDTNSHDAEGRNGCHWLPSLAFKSFPFLISSSRLVFSYPFAFSLLSHLSTLSDSVLTAETITRNRLSGVLQSTIVSFGSFSASHLVTGVYCRRMCVCQRRVLERELATFQGSECIWSRPGGENARTPLEFTVYFLSPWLASFLF